MGGPPWTLPLISREGRVAAAPPVATAGPAPSPVSMAPPPVSGTPFFEGPAMSHDGALIGFVNGQATAFPPGTAVGQIPGVRPSDGRPVTHTIIYVNGILNDPQGHFNSLQGIADAAGAEVVGVFNASEGAATDLAQCVQDKLDLGHNPAVDTLANTLYQQLTTSDQPVNIMAHSQGGLITSRALEDVQLMLMADGMSRQQAAQTMSRLNVETFGAAAWSYTDGPQYNHHMNRLDYVSNLTGLGPSGIPILGMLFDPGAGANTHYFTSTAGNFHGFDEVYLPNWDNPFPQGPPR